MSIASRPIEQPDKAETTPKMTEGIVAQIVARLPQFITLFFSFTLVSFFRAFTDMFHFTTAPAVNWRDGSQVLIVVSFVVTLFWIVTAWLGYSVLIARYPYTVDLGRFFFDVARFSLLNFQMNFAFLAGQVASFHVYIFSIALWHGMMTGWYVWRSRRRQTSAIGRDETEQDATSHGVRLATYLLLGLLYYFVVASRPGEPGAEALRYVIAGVTFLMMVLWNVRRILELTARAGATVGRT